MTDPTPFEDARDAVARAITRKANDLKPSCSADDLSLLAKAVEDLRPPKPSAAPVSPPQTGAADANPA